MTSISNWCFNKNKENNTEPNGVIFETQIFKLLIIFILIIKYFQIYLQDCSNTKNTPKKRPWVASGGLFQNALSKIYGVYFVVKYKPKFNPITFYNLDINKS